MLNDFSLVFKFKVKMSEVELFTCILIVDTVLEDEKEEKKGRKVKRIWVKEWLRKRPKYSHMNLLKELEESSVMDCKNFLRMDVSSYQELLEMVSPFIKKEDTVMRDAISTNERLSATLRFLATGQSFEDLKFLTAISPQALGKVIIETCKAIIKVLKEYIKLPRNEREWKSIAQEYGTLWNFPNCIGAIDGKHIEIRKPFSSGSYYFNYKKTFSVVLMALVNAKYEFLMVEVGANGRVSDGGVFSNTKFYEKYEEKMLNIPQPEKLHASGEEMPFVFVGDDAFPLKENLMKPYKQRDLTDEQDIFNYRLSRARRVVENAFGILFYHILRSCVAFYFPQLW